MEKSLRALDVPIQSPGKGAVTEEGWRPDFEREDGLKGTWSCETSALVRRTVEMDTAAKGTRMRNCARDGPGSMCSQKWVRVQVQAALHVPWREYSLWRVFRLQNCRPRSFWLQSSDAALWCRRFNCPRNVISQFISSCFLIWKLKSLVIGWVD